MLARIVVTAVGAELVVAPPSGHTQPAWIAVILGGPALFLAGRARFEYAVFTRALPICHAGPETRVADDPPGP